MAIFHPSVNVTFIETLLKGRRWFLDPGAWGVFRMHRHQVPKRNVCHPPSTRTQAQRGEKQQRNASATFPPTHQSGLQRPLLGLCKTSAWASAPTPAPCNLFTQTGDPSIKNINLIQFLVHSKPFAHFKYTSSLSRESLAPPASDTRSRSRSSHPRSSWGLWICRPLCSFRYSGGRESSPQRNPGPNAWNLGMFPHAVIKVNPEDYPGGP